MKELIKISEIFPVSAKRLFDAWLDSYEHSKFTGVKANIKPNVGSKFTAGDGYISGTNIALQPYGRIVQSWRSTDFPAGAINSKLEILFEKVNGGTRVRIIHTNIPSGQAKEFEKGWKKHYFKPMKKYFKEHK
jgi:activator of HSP90 ATPase